jgi:hypothetical protein
MSFERRITYAAAAAVAVAVLLAAVASYFIVRQELRSSVDSSLRSALTATQSIDRFGLPPGRFERRPGHNASSDCSTVHRIALASLACSSWSPRTARSREPTA